MLSLYRKEEHIVQAPLFTFNQIYYTILTLHCQYMFVSGNSLMELRRIVQLMPVYFINTNDLSSNSHLFAKKSFLQSSG